MSYAVVDESCVSRQHRRPRPGPPIPGSVRGRPEQPSERPTQQMELRIEIISVTAGTHQSLDARNLERIWINRGSGVRFLEIFRELWHVTSCILCNYIVDNWRN